MNQNRLQTTTNQMKHLYPLIDEKVQEQDIIILNMYEPKIAANFHKRNTIRLNTTDKPQNSGRGYSFKTEL